MNICDWIDGWARLRPGHVALHFEGRDISYAQMKSQIGRLVASLTDLGVRPGDRIAHLGFNSPEYLYLVFACARLGAMLVPLNWRLAAAEHAYIIEHSGASFVSTETEFQTHCEPLRSQFPHVRWLSCPLSAVDVGPGAGRSRGTPLIVPGAGNHDRPLLLVYTSGTTGRPKGALLTQGVIFWNAINATHAHDLSSADHVLTDLPMFHVGGLNIQTLPALHAGATVTLHRRFDPEQALTAIEDRRPSIYLVVPPTMHALTRQPRWATADLSSLRVVMAGSATIPEALLRTFIDRGVLTGQIYGTTETGPIAMYLRAEQAAAHIGSCGQPAVHCQVRILDESDCDAKTGERGEIVVRGPNVMTEYWDDPGATHDSFVDGYFRTGDIGHVDADGFFYIDDRKHDVIVSGGENIYPAELENILAECAEIEEYAVVAGVHPKWGQVPVAVVVPAGGGSLDRTALLARFDGRLARFKHPREVVVVASLPRNAMGKVLKYELRRRIAEQDMFC